MNTINTINTKPFAFCASLIVLTWLTWALADQALAAKKLTPKQIPAAEVSNCTITVTTLYTNDDAREQIFTPPMDTQKDCEKAARMHQNAVTKGVKSKSAKAEWGPRE